ncbi:MAG: hypothetical protein M0Z81_05375, partial [Deltaproteobacteria bacterium]|nr:hypothetical protein [Deltaproteobacteria bacterium]
EILEALDGNMIPCFGFQTELGFDLFTEAPWCHRFRTSEMGLMLKLLTIQYSRRNEIFPKFPTRKRLSETCNRKH